MTDELEAAATRLFEAHADRAVPTSVREALRHVGLELLGARGAVGGGWAHGVAAVILDTPARPDPT